MLTIVSSLASLCSNFSSAFSNLSLLSENSYSFEGYGCPSTLMTEITTDVKATMQENMPVIIAFVNIRLCSIKNRRQVLLILDLIRLKYSYVGVLLVETSIGLFMLTCSHRNLLFRGLASTCCIHNTLCVDGVLHCKQRLVMVQESMSKGVTYRIFTDRTRIIKLAN